MELLIDTHALLWLAKGDGEKLSSKARLAIESSQNQKHVSMATFWEIAIKLSVGKLELDGGIESLVEFANEFNFKILTIDMDHIKVSQNLQFIHRDPFDRLLIAQAISQDFQVVTKDPAFSLYPIKTIW